MMTTLRKLVTKMPVVDRAAHTLAQVGRNLIARAYYRTHQHEIDQVFARRYSLPFPPTHYYSPLPDLTLVKSNFQRWYKESQAPGIDWNFEEQCRLTEKTAEYAGEMSGLPTFACVAQDGYGPGYGEVEAYLLYMLLRHLKPSRCIEVGSGVSTFYTLNALRTNREKDGVASRLTCVEPYPNEKLRELVSRDDVYLHACEVQNLEFRVFEELQPNDVLFIDTSHVSKMDSDVDFLYLEVLPRLHSGVVIHIHDMPFPMPAIPPEHRLFDSYLFWNEAALVKAFLLFNPAFKVMMCQSYLHRRASAVLKNAVPVYNPNLHFPSSLWLRKVV